MQYQFPCSIPRQAFYTHSLDKIVHFKLFWDSLRGKQIKKHKRGEDEKMAWCWLTGKAWNRKAKTSVVGVVPL